MKFARATAAACVLLALAGCGGRRESRPVGPKQAAAVDWRQVATPADRERLRNWRDSWMIALAQAKGQDDGAIAREAELFQPDRALPGAVPPPGRYRCRVFKLGTFDPFLPAFVSYPYFACKVDDRGEVDGFTKTEGSQRPVGLLFPDGPSRGVFLGTLALGDERSAMDYGRDVKRDMAGLVERIGAKRWRIVLPAPQFESKLDVIELVAVD